MKTTLSFLIALALAPAAFPDDYTVFRVCQDQHVIRTSDGAEAGHLEYVVIDPGNRQVVSTVVTGGVIGEKYVAVPYESMHFGADREIVLTQITRERLVSAPVIERSRFTSTNVFQRAWLEPTSQHFGVRFDASFREGERRDERGTARTNESTNPRENERGTARTNEPNAGRESRGTAEAERNGGRPGQAATDPAQGERSRSEAERRNDGRATTDAGGNANRQNERNRPEAIGEKTPERPDAKNRPGREPATPEPKTNADREKNAAEKNQEKASRPGEDVDRDPGKAAEKAQRETGKAGEKAESATDKGRAKAEREALQNAEKSGQATEKAQEKGERPAGKAEEKSERPQKKSDSEKRTPEEAQR